MEAVRARRTAWSQSRFERKRMRVLENAGAPKMVQHVKRVLGR